jgi:hypothetical protein
MASTANLNFRSGVQSDKVHSLTIDFIKEIGVSSNNLNLEVSSAARSAYDQAAVMYKNCENLGVASQYKLYGWNGDRIIRIYEKMKAEKKKPHKPLDIIKAMHKKIMDIGPSKVSKHCVDINVMNVIDIPFSCIQNKQAFRDALKKHHPSPISKYLDETNNNCFHLEFKIDDLKKYFKA